MYINDYVLGFISSTIFILWLEGKSKDLLTMKQNEVEWMVYSNTMKHVIESSKLPRRIFYDLRGNHDSFGVPASGGDYDFYEKYSINANLRRQGRVQSITLEVSASYILPIAYYFFSVF